MSDAQRQRTQNGEDAGYASASAEASLGREHLRGDHGRDARPQDESERVAVISGRSEESAIVVQVVGRTDVGLVREHNEDNYLLADLNTGSRDAKTFHEVSSSGLLLAVCDGMGGAAAGEVASQMAVDTLYEMMRRSVPPADRDALARSLVNAIEEAGTRIFESARADRSKRGMGTTATVAALMDKTLFVGQVGDSRAYILRSGELKQITKDQSLVNQLIEAGQLTEDEAEAFEHSNIILQALGTTEQVSVDLTFLELRRGDRLLMCSDGLSGLVHGDVLREVLVELKDLGTCCERLIELAKAGGGHDNVTVILAEFGGEALALPQSTDLAGYQQYPLPLDHERRPMAALNSDLPTLAPPSQGAPAVQVIDAPRTRSHAPAPSGSGRRLLVLAMLLLGATGAVYYWMAARERRARRADAYQTLAVAPTTETAPLHGSVIVHTDVESGELTVDGDSHGAGTDGTWNLDLPPGPHEFEVLVGGSRVATGSLTVRQGGQDTIWLEMPKGTTSPSASDAAVAEEEVASGSEVKPSRRERRAQADAGRRRRSEDVGGAMGAASAGDTPPAKRDH